MWSLECCTQTTGTCSLVALSTRVEMLATTASRLCAPPTTSFWTSMTIRAVWGRSVRVVMPPTLGAGTDRPGTLPPMSEPPTDRAPEHASVSCFRAELERRVGTGRIVVLPDSVHTAQLAADALGCEVGAIANSLLFDADGEPLLLMTS